MTDIYVLSAYTAGIAGILGESLAAGLTQRPLRRILYSSAAVCTALAIICALIGRPHAGIIIAAVIGCFRIFNAARVVAERMHIARLKSVTRRTSVVLIGLQLISVFSWQLSSLSDMRSMSVITALALFSCCAALIMLGTTIRTIRRSSAHVPDRLDMSDLPTVTICIPARNESAALPSCIGSLLDLDYAKLEIIVLDDCSQDASSEIIKGFARKGVRFIKGGDPIDGWLAKNQAYDTLAAAANGEYLVFCGVDIRMESDALRQLMAILRSRNKQMASIMPRRAANAPAAQTIIQPVRYWWEIALPRRLFNRPPVLSSTWIIKAEALHKAGGFKAVDNMVVPEAYFARELVRQDGYSFLLAGKELGITSDKDAAEQKATAIRTKYAQLRKRPEWVLLLLCIETVVLLGPIGLCILGLITDVGIALPLAVMAYEALLFTHSLIYKSWTDRGITLAIVLFPAMVLADLIILIISMFQYEFGTITCKDRNICIPVMQVIPRLPKV